MEFVTQVKCLAFNCAIKPCLICVKNHMSQVFDRWFLTFFKKCKQKNAVIFYSDLTLKELQRYYSQERINILLNTVSGFCELKKLKIIETQFNKARLLSLKFGVHLSDSLHAIFAKENIAVLITTDKHFEKLSSFIKVVRPEEII